MTACFFARLLAVGLAYVIAACSGMPEPAAPLSPPTRLCTERQPSVLCRSAADVETALRAPELVVLGAAETPRGRQGARILTLALPTASGRYVFRAKWRAYSTLSTLSDPRRELAAHAVQRLFLEPHAYVTPPAAGHCFALASYRQRVDAAAHATFPGIDCVFGVLSYWLEHGSSLDESEDAGWLSDDQRAFDARRFREAPSYRDSAADLNVLTFLIEHGDSHPDQFVIGGPAGRPRLYLVDNSLSFGSFRNPTVVEDWSRLLVPSIRRDTAERLRRITPAELSALAVVEQYARSGGRLVHTEPRSPVSADAGLRWAGSELQVGLASGEVARLARRLNALRAQLANQQLTTH